MAFVFGKKKPDYAFNFHDDEALHDNTPGAKKWYANLGGDAVAAARMARRAATKGFSQAAKDTLPELDINDPLSRAITKELVSDLWGSMLHPPQSYRGETFQYRTADGLFNNILHPELGMAGLPYAKTVQAKRPMLGAKPDPGDLFDLLMARDENDPKESPLGISSLLLYHATLIIHDIFRTDEGDKNISDTSSYLDLTPLYGNNLEAQKAVRTFSKGFLKPDTFAEHRLLTQPPGVCAYLLMYNRFHNYVAEQLLQIDENSRFSIPSGAIWARMTPDEQIAAVKKQDEDLFQTARLVTCGMYIQIAIHDYLRCLMCMHPSDTPWTLDPRVEFPEKKNKAGLSRGEGNMVSLEFNLLYRFHSPISVRDAKWSEIAIEHWIKSTNRVKPDATVTQEQLHKGEFITESMLRSGDIPVPFMRNVIDDANKMAKASWKDKEGKPFFPESFGPFKRGKDGKFSDEELVTELTRTMEDPIHQFGARNIPKVFRSIEILGMLQARKWELATLNEFREFFGMPRHTHFEDVNDDPAIQQALRDLYEDPDMIEFYPGWMVEGHGRCLDPGTSCPGNVSTALWRGVFSDAVTLVRSDRFYTTDWNVNSLTSWGFKEVASDPKINKGSVFHRLFQRAFPGYFRYNSIYMWQPFYTPAMNLICAQQQGYLSFLDLAGLEYNVAKGGAAKWQDIKITDFQKAKYEDLSHRVRRKQSDIRARAKPLNVADYDDIKKILGGDQTTWVNPGILVPQDVPAGPLREILCSTWHGWKKAINVFDKCVHSQAGKGQEFIEYFTSMARDIRVREQRKFQPMTSRKTGKVEQVYQLDIIKDYAIPVVTRFFVDFLGIWDQVKTPDFVDRTYTENQIYEHLDNCQNYQSWDADETKTWARRVSYQKSIKFLKELAETGIAQSDSGLYGGATWIKRAWLGAGHKADPDYVQKLRKIAVETIAELRKSFTREQVAAVMLAFALDIAHKIVLTFTEILAYFIDPVLHGEGGVGKVEEDTKTARWEELTIFAAQDTAKSDSEITKYVLEAQRLSYKLRLARQYKGKLASDIVAMDFDGNKEQVQPERLVLLDVYAASQAKFDHPDQFRTDRKTKDYLIYGENGTFTKRMSLYAMTGLLKHAAQLKELRVAHDKLGRLKRVETPDKLMRYASPQWDRLLPFPTTWNVRFNGEGQGVFDGGDNANQGHGIDQVYLATEQFAKVEGSMTSGPLAYVLSAAKDTVDAIKGNPRTVEVTTKEVMPVSIAA